MKPADTRAFIIAVAEHAENQERKAHAEFYWHLDAAQRAGITALGPDDRPWRGFMQPSLVHIINVLEENDHYDVSGLTIPEQHRVAGLAKT